MNALTAMAPAMLSEAGAPVFLMSVAKPLVTFLAFVPYAAVVSGKLEKDAAYFNLKPQKWAFTFLGFGTAALLAALLIPTWIAGFPVMIGLMVRHKSVCFHKVWQIDFGVIHSMFDDLAETPTSYPSFFILARRFASIYIYS